MSWFKRDKAPLPPAEQKSPMPEGLWSKCRECAAILYKKEVQRNLNVCPNCNYHMGLSARERVLSLVDDAEFETLDLGIRSNDPLKFDDTKRYEDRLRRSRAATGLDDAILVIRGDICGVTTIIAAMEYGFIGGSMGVAVGEALTRAAERSLDERRPLIIVSRSGGARMQEGAMSLMQMAKISAALARLDDAGLPYISILSDPTTGGVTASFAMLGDLNIAEPKALIGFAGPRVIEQTIRQPLPDGFQRSEYLLEHGMIDFILERSDMKATLGNMLRFFTFGSDTPSRGGKLPKARSSRSDSSEAQPEEPDLAPERSPR